MPQRLVFVIIFWILGPVFFWGTTLEALEFDNTNVLVEAAVNHIYQKRYKDALQMLQQAFDQSPRNPGVNYNLGRVYELTGNFKEAYKFYQVAVALDSTLVSAQRGIGRCSVELKRQQAMEQSQTLKSAAEETNNQVPISQGGSPTEYSQEAPVVTQRQPISLYQEPTTTSSVPANQTYNNSQVSPNTLVSPIQNMEPSNPSLMEVKTPTEVPNNNAEKQVEEQLEKGQPEQAIKTLNWLIENNQDSPRLHYYYGKAFSAKGDLFSAIKHLEASLKADSHFYASYYLLAQNYAKVNLLDEAIKNFLTYFAIKPQSNVAIEIAKVYERMGKAEQAREFYSKANSMNPGNPNIQSKLASVDAESATNFYFKASNAFAKGEFEKAISLYEQALQLKENLSATYRIDAERKLDVARLKKFELDKQEAPQTQGFKVSRQVYATVDLKYYQLTNLRFRNKFTGPVTVEWRGFVARVFPQYGREFVLMIKELDQDELDEMRHDQNSYQLNPNMNNQPLFLVTSQKGNLPPFIKEGKMITFTGQTDWKSYNIINDLGQTVKLPAFDLISAFP
ncbi:MAG: tetratricopeptide repeat protein [Candidatus Riflebacteria bacterium]|nr:tetratricopeptide repeat protein [Candidatus Riflebacteria bacterium]